MPKQTVGINFAQALDTKSDPWQLALGKFLSLVNMVRTKGGLLAKRPGYGLLTSKSPAGTHLTTLNDNLTLVGSTVSAYSDTLDSWITKGTLQPCSLNVLPLIRNNLNQTQNDTVVSNGLVLTTYTENLSGTIIYRYAIADVVTGQNIVEPTAFPVISGGTISGSSRAFVVGNYFVVISQVTVAGVKHLQYISIPVMNPVLVTNLPNVSAAQSVTAEVYSAVSSNPGWDAVAINNASNSFLVVAYNSTTTAQGVHVATLTQQQIAMNQTTSTIRQFNNAAYIGAIVSICVDLTVSPNIFYISFWNNATMNGYTAAVYVGFGIITQQFAPVQIITGIAVANLASAAEGGSCTVFSEVTNAYSYDSGTPSNFIDGVSVGSSGSVGTPYVVVRSLGLASKAFIVNGVKYFLAAYQSPFQPTYFLINASISTSAKPIVVAKLAYQNGGGYVTLGLPSVSIVDGLAQISYLYKDDVEALNTLNNPQQSVVGGIYSQTGINLVSFNVTTDEISTSEIASNLHISGGYLSQYDGYLPVEHNFFLFPDSVKAASSGTTGSMTAQQYYYQVTYEWTDNQGLPYRSAPSIPVTVTLTTGTSVDVSIPTLRLTAKIDSPVKLVIYRWSAGNQVYNQVTSITLPTLNDTTADSITYNDKLADASIIGNNLIYTTGGVVPDTNGPSSDVMTIFDTRLWLVDAEDRNLLWVSKQVVEQTPIEMSSLFTIYVAPNIGTTQSTGGITALAPMDDKIIIFKKNAIYYVNGAGPDNLGSTAVGCSLGNYSQPTFIAGIVGCTNQDSLVLTNEGLMFQSDKGIWLLPRTLGTPQYIGSPVEAFNNLAVTSAEIIPDTNYVVFTLENNQMLMYDYFYQQWGEFQGLYAVSSCIHQGLHTVLDKYGNVLQATPNLYMDNANPVLLSFATGWINLATLQGYERIYDFYMLARFLSPHSLLVQVAYDYNDSVLNQTLITPKNYSSPDPGPFGVPTPFAAKPDVEQWRVHAKQQLCQSFQLKVTEVFNPAYATIPGAGFTMSGITLNVDIKKSTRPIRAGNTAGTA